MCTCISDTEKVMTDHFIKMNGPLVEKATMIQKALIFGKKSSVRVFVEFESYLPQVTKSGKTNRKKLTQSMMLSKCPFCGESYESEEKTEEEKV